MSIRLKIATTPKEIDDVFWLRHEVYVKEDGKFGGMPLPHERISDRFDAFPKTANIIAYEGDEPVATLRASLGSDVGLPSEDLFDFSGYMKSLDCDNPVVAGGGMFAIREKWRRKRNVILAMLKMITGIYHSWGVTHVIATSNHETVSVYTHLGFEALHEQVWNEHVGNFIVPMATPFDRMYKWAFGTLFDGSLESFWIDNFSRHFERVLLSKDEVLFSEGDDAPFAYIIDDGFVGVSRKDPNGEELTLANLARGDLLGELALLDKKPRSATATAVTNVELIRLDRETLLGSVRNRPELLEQLLSLFALRIRRTDDLAMVMAFAPQTGRVKFALERLCSIAIASDKEPGQRVVRIGPAELAKSSGVREHEVLRVLELEKLAGNLDYGKNMVKFLK